MRNYTTDLPGGTATTSLQIQGSGTIKEISLSLTNAAAGKLEFSKSPTSQIGTAAPTSDVVFRVNCSGTAGPAQTFVLPCSVAVKAFETIYFHQTGTGNLGTVNFRV